ncbi:MAG: hypothetical protein MJE68_07370, partial [Proteobacteria bacterium]|nr:hypothetical protein [Pseudomonadota bacterium]
MMQNKHQYDYKFVIEGLKPDQISVERLGEYFVQIARMLGVPKKMHVRDIRSGSHALAFSIDAPYVAVAKDMEGKLREGTAPIHVKNAHAKIIEMLREDKTPARLEGTGIIEFPVQAKEDVPDRIIRDEDTFKGRVLEISYRGNGKADDDDN